MGLIIQIEKKHVRVDYRTAIQRKKGTLLAGLSLYFICCIFFYGMEQRVLYLRQYVYDEKCYT